jgi:hypothetical protein
MADEGNRRGGDSAAAGHHDQGVATPSAPPDALPRRRPRRSVRPVLKHGLAALTGLAVLAIVIIAITAPVGTAGEMTGNAWLPLGLRVSAVVVYVGVMVVHLWHLRAGALRERVWHATHVLMALGMIDMFAPTHHLIVAAELGRLVFVVAAVGTLAYVAAVVVRGERLGWLWPALAADLAAMAYMFVMPIPGFTWLTGVLVAWFALEAAGWVTGSLPSRADLGSAAGGRVGATAYPSSRMVSIRVSLAVMNLGMAYMLLAMEFGMAPMPAMAPMPGMTGM